MKKELSGTLAFLAGAALAAGITLLFTTEKGTELREKVAEWLKEKGIQIKESELDELMGRILSRGKKCCEPETNNPVVPDEPSLGE